MKHVPRFPGTGNKNYTRYFIKYLIYLLFLLSAGSAQPGVSQHEPLHDVGVEALEVVPGVALLTRDGGVTRAHVLTAHPA